MGFLLRAVRGLSEHGVEMEDLSSVYETPPLGYLQQPPFLNLVLVGRTSLGPREILALSGRLEREAGRERSFPHAPRTLDVDLIFHGGRIVREPGARVPHPRWRERSFVVLPLLETLPGFRDPETGWQVAEVARAWPLEPREIRVVESPEVFRAALRKGNR